MLPAQEAANTRASPTMLSNRRKQGEMEKQQQKGQGSGEKNPGEEETAPNDRGSIQDGWDSRCNLSSHSCLMGRGGLFPCCRSRQEPW